MVFKLPQRAFAPKLGKLGNRFVFNPGRSSGTQGSVPPVDTSGAWSAPKGGAAAEDSPD